MATDNFWDKFARWRRHRPFWGGLFLVLSALEMFLSANMSVGGIEIHLGPQGFLSYLLPLMLVVCGLLVWFTPAQRTFYGIIALLTALYSLLGLNLGGFFVGMLLGIAGGGLVIAWGPPRNQPPAEPQDAPPPGEPADVDPEQPRDPETTQILEVAGHDDRPHEQPIRPAFVPGTEEEPPKSGNAMQRLGRGQKALVLVMVPLVITASILVVSSTLPASADECPTASSSVSAATTTTTTTAAADATKAAAAAATTPTAKTTSASAKASASASASAASDSSSTDSGNAVADGIEQFIDGVGNLLGINDAETSSPSESPSPSQSASASTSATPTPTATTAATPTSPSSTTATSTATATASSSAATCTKTGLTASATDAPIVSLKPGTMKVGTLTMDTMLYEGVATLKTTGGGSVKVLKFSMKSATNTPFSLTVNEPNGGTTTITSDKLITKGDVQFYTPDFQGLLIGVLPVHYTVDNEPPKIPLSIFFTKVTIQLAFVRCNTLTGDPLKVTES